MYVFFLEMTEKMLANALELEEISIPPSFVFLVMVICNTQALD